jgi:hypothetical protein
VEILSDAFGVCSEEICLGGLQASVLNDGFHGGEDLLLLVKTIYVGHITGVEDVVDVFQEGFTLDLKAG